MGIYIHIPFCRSKCYYCGFYSVAATQLKAAYIQALKQEIVLRKDYLGTTEAQTVYFGGGTPSGLNIDELAEIVTTVENHFSLEHCIERTIEANPEDISLDHLKAWRALGFNRVSIGVQSFNDDVLKRINRTHSARQAIQAIEQATSLGFDNIGIDLIIGLPGYTLQHLKNDLKIINSLSISHLSVYILSIDSNTVFEKLMQKGKFKPQDDDELAEQYLWVSDYLKTIGFEHYEISNFAKNSKYSVHNTSYWQQKKYIGFGPAAHSFDIDSRQWNVSNLKTYIDSLNEGKLNFEKEILTNKDRYNEYIMTNLRTMWGIEEKKMQYLFPFYWESVYPKIENYLQNDRMTSQNGRLCLTEKGWLISDEVFSELFMI